MADQKRLTGVSRGQSADYVVMVCLAKLRPEARLGDARTIPKLFDAAPQAEPAGLTDWDQAFPEIWSRREAVFVPPPRAAWGTSTIAWPPCGGAVFLWAPECRDEVWRGQSA